VIERQVNEKTISEAKAYALFFALVANDRGQFERLLSRTRNNLANSDVRHQQPAWLWGAGTDPDGPCSMPPRQLTSISGWRTRCFRLDDCGPALG
jgi:hypothetical protein